MDYVGIRPFPTHETIRVDPGHPQFRTPKGADKVVPSLARFSAPTRGLMRAPRSRVPHSRLPTRARRVELVCIAFRPGVLALMRRPLRPSRLRLQLPQRLDVLQEHFAGLRFEIAVSEQFLVGQDAVVVSPQLPEMGRPMLRDEMASGLAFQGDRARVSFECLEGIAHLVVHYGDVHAHHGPIEHRQIALHELFENLDRTFAIACQDQVGCPAGEECIALFVHSTFDSDSFRVEFSP